MKAWQGIREGISENIKGTELDPVFQTFLIGLTDYKFDVPDGNYEVKLYFAEPFNKARRLNPEEKTGSDPEGNRIFDVYVNSTAFLYHLNLAEQFGEQQAVIENFRTSVRDGKGITIHFQPIKGEPVLNGIKIRKL